MGQRTQPNSREGNIIEYYKGKSIRLPNYDYNMEGYYFVTICTKGQKSLFGEIFNNEMNINEKGQLTDNLWNSIEEKFDNVFLDEYIIMPNHIHGILVFQKYSNTSLPDIIEYFKRISTNMYIKNVKKFNWERFNKKLWQENYYEHIIRNEKELVQIRNYIRNNPLKWGLYKDDYTHNYL